MRLGFSSLHDRRTDLAGLMTGMKTPREISEGQILADGLAVDVEYLMICTCSFVCWTPGISSAWAADARAERFAGRNRMSIQPKLAIGGRGEP
jgi:hypothetical protein